MPSGGTMARARKRTNTKGKAQPATSTAPLKTKELTPNGTRLELTQSSISQSSHQSSQVQTAVTAQQSSDVVQTFLFSVASAILWMRDLLPEEYFRTAFYASINKHCSYHDFTSGSGEGIVAQGDRSRPKGYHLRVLKRNVSTRGDQIIKWLETGIFEAIKLGYLDQLQICIFADEEQPIKVLEVYCFHFHYSEISQDGSIAVDMEVEDDQTKKKVSLKDAREALNTVVRNMVSLNGTMPHLPERCFMSPYLVWTCGQVQTCSQRIKISIAYTKGVAFNDDAEAIVMPDFTYGAAFSRLEPFMQASNPQQQEEFGDNDAQELPTPRPSSAMGDEVASSTPIAQMQHVPASVHDNGTHASRDGSIDADVSTQDKEDLSRLKALQPVEQYQMHDTQLVPRPPSTHAQLDLSPATTQGLQGKPHAIENPRTRTVQGSSSSELMAISCECDTKETGNIIQCHGCHGWQHAQCYAYEGPGDTRMSTEHMCFTCLLGNASGDQLDKAKQLTRTRQVLHCIQVRGLTSSARIAKTLGYTRSDVAKLLGELEQNDIVLLKSSRKESDHVLLVLTEVAKRVLAAMYLDPSTIRGALVRRNGFSLAMDELTNSSQAGDAAGGRGTQSTPGRKRKGRGSPAGDVQPKTPRLSRAHRNLAFDSNAPYTPDGERSGGRSVE